MEERTDGARATEAAEEPKRPCWPSRLLVLAAVLVAVVSILGDLLG